VSLDLQPISFKFDGLLGLIDFWKYLLRYTWVGKDSAKHGPAYELTEEIIGRA
jgi:hypothetical protein